MNEGDEMVDICKCKSMQFLSATQMVCQGNHHKTQALDQIRFSETILYIGPMCRGDIQRRRIR